MHTVDLIAGLLASRDVRLVGYDHKRESQLPQAITGLDNAGQQAQLLDARGRVRYPITDFDLVEHPIAIEEDRGAGSDDSALIAHVSNRPARTSTSIAAIESRRASSQVRSFFQPSDRIRSELSRTIGTSPFQPRSPPVYSNIVCPAGSPTTSTAISAISVTVR